MAAEGEGMYNDNIHVLKKVMGLMFNKRKYSDAVFTVKDQNFYVLSHLLSASSTILDELITTHYEHCQDKDLKIYNVKHEDSFLLILKYIYGQPLDFQKTPVHIICEVLCLADRYKLSEFKNDLKRFLSTLNCFELKSVVVLLNTASKYNISELYKRLTVFAYEHAEQLVKHNTFPDLDYTVLTDLVKSDWFACSEIDILTGVLTWHSGMDRERQNWKTTTSQDDIETETDDTSETDPTQSEYQDIEQIDHLDLKQKDTCSSADNSEQLVEKRDTCPEVMRLFSENILKTLLAQIRFPRLFASDLLKALKSELGKNYIDLMDETYFSQSSETRKIYQEPSNNAAPVQHRDNNNAATVQHRDNNNAATVQHRDNNNAATVQHRDNNNATTVQHRDNNNAATVQHRDNNNAATVQHSDDNTAATVQHRDNNNAATVQHSDNNNAATVQHRDNNNAATLQHSDNNNAATVQHRDNNNAATVQHRDNNNAATVQHSDDNTAATVQHRDNNNAATVQHSDDNTAATVQHRDNNNAATVQHSDNNNAATVQHRDNNNATNVQHRDNNNAATLQHSDNNNAAIVQHRDNNNAATVQHSDNNNAATAQHSDNNNTATVQHRVINNVTKSFQIQIMTLYLDTMYESQEEYRIGDVKWKICMKWTVDGTRDEDTIAMYLKCTSDNNQKDWKCTVECQLKWISHDSRYNSMILPNDNSYTTLTLTGDTSCVEIGNWVVDIGGVSDDWWRAFRPNFIYTFHLDIKSMQININVSKKEIHNVSLATTTQHSDHNTAATVHHRDNNNATTAQHRVINNVTKSFQIQIIILYWHNMYESQEEYLLGDLKWKICSKWTRDNIRYKCFFTIYLKCSSDNNQKDWKCTVECQVKWISHDSRYNNMILPDDNSYTTLTLTGDTSCVEIGKWEVDWEVSPDWWRAFRPNGIHTFHLDINIMQTKMMK